MASFTDDTTDDFAFDNVANTKRWYGFCSMYLSMLIPLCSATLTVDDRDCDPAPCSSQKNSSPSANDSGFDETRSPQSSEASLPCQYLPPRPEDVIRTLKHINLQKFGKAFERAANIAFPSHNRSRYSNVYVLMFSWESEDQRLPVRTEIADLRKVFEDIYHYKVEEYKIPDQRSHNKVCAKINDFIEANNDDAADLKIVYYAGHAILSKTKEVVWTRQVKSTTFAADWHLQIPGPLREMRNVQRLLGLPYKHPFIKRRAML